LQSKKEQDKEVKQPLVMGNVDGEPGELNRLALEPAESVIAAGDRVPAKYDEIEDLAEGDGHHGEIDAAQAHDERADDRASKGADGDAHQDSEPRRRDEILDGQSAAIGA